MIPTQAPEHLVVPDVSGRDCAEAAGARARDELLVWLRRNLVLLLLDALGLRATLALASARATPGTTEWRALEAGRALGLVDRGPGGWGWAPGYRLPDAMWDEIIAMIGHQLSYLELAVEIDGAPVAKRPSEQLAENPLAYQRFLAGVDLSHRQHARWLAGRPELRTARTLVDLGGGHGVFSRAWVASNPARTARLLDLPGVDGGPAGGTADGRLVRGPIDLEAEFELPAPADVYLLANVLHLLPAWPGVIARVARAMPVGARLLVFEADPSGPAGRLFDLQVHLRSGRRGGLLQPVDVVRAVEAAGLRLRSVLTTSSPADVYRRQYMLWVAGKEEAPS